MFVYSSSETGTKHKPDSREQVVSHDAQGPDPVLFVKNMHCNMPQTCHRNEPEDR